MLMKVIILGSKASLQYTDAVVDDPKQRRPDITLAKTWLNWTPRVYYILIKTLPLKLSRNTSRSHLVKV